ncbi:MAG: NAD-dependent epimerase/dehydratase family protein [Rikenellaceae bacterium]
MNLLFTGATGFLGGNTMPFLQDYNITTLGFEPSNLVINLANEVPVLPNKYDIVLHAAGKAHVAPRNDQEEQQFYDVNLQGTINLTKAIEEVGVPNSFVFISTVAVYGIDEGENITEDHPTNPTTPYGISKLKAEQYLVKWSEKNNVNLTILRPSLIAGSNPPGNLGAMISGISSGKYLSIGKAAAQKSILMVEDIANLVRLCYGKNGIYNVCSQTTPTFKELELSISKQLGKKLPLSIPLWLAKMIAKVGDLLGSKAPINTLKLKKITQSLTFSSQKAQTELGWKPLDIIPNFKIK